MCIHINTAPIVNGLGSLISLVGFVYLSAGVLASEGLKPITAKVLADPNKSFLGALLVRVGCIVLKPFNVIPEPGTRESIASNLSVSGQPDDAAPKRIFMGAGLTVTGTLLQILANFI